VVDEIKFVVAQREQKSAFFFFVNGEDKNFISPRKNKKQSRKNGGLRPPRLPFFGVDSPFSNLELCGVLAK